MELNLILKKALRLNRHFHIVNDDIHAYCRIDPVGWFVKNLLVCSAVTFDSSVCT